MKSQKLPAFTDNAYQYEHRDWFPHFMNHRNILRPIFQITLLKVPNALQKIVHMQVFPFPS